MTRMRWGLALAAAVALMVGCAPVAAPVTDPDAPLVALYGDSYTLGTGASAREKRWSTIICAERGWNEFNFSYPRVPDGQIRDAIAGDLARLGWVHDEADAVGAEWISGASRWLEGHPEWMASDGLHPNDAGYAQLAAHMDAELTALGL
jgi:lysophospholipase L1-like esterase